MEGVSMTKRKKDRPKAATQQSAVVPSPTQANTTVPSLLDAMQEDNEYGSIVALTPANPELLPDLRRAVQKIEEVRGRRCLVYAANLIKDLGDRQIQAADHLPFCEMVAKVPMTEKKIDIFLATPGGSAEQVNLFVEALRPRFEDVEFLIPYKAMSAGTLWALSGDAIWMDARAFLGPLDPQVLSKDGTFVPAQSLITLLQLIQAEGQAALARKESPPWALIRLLDVMDQKGLGLALSATSYVTNIAATYLESYKFRGWLTHTSSGSPVTPEEKKERATWIAAQLASHEKWKAHGHAISRDVLWQELKVKIRHPEELPGLQREMRRLWALLYYTFDRMPIIKVMLSREYSFFRQHLNVLVQAS
jgi:hypothetical protein